jgi:hypothetical protein
MGSIYIGTASNTPLGPVDVDDTGLVPGSRLLIGLLAQPGLAHHVISLGELCFDSFGGSFVFSSDPTPGDALPGHTTDLVTIDPTGLTVKAPGVLTVESGQKNFSIPHPLDPDRMRLVHGCLEGPEYAVFYRGQARLEDGVTTVMLPTYFEVLTMEQGRTIQLTPLAEGDGPISALAASRVRNGAFTVRALDESNPSQEFYWEVKAVRSDVEPLTVEVQRSDSSEMAEEFVEPVLQGLKS